MQEARKLQGLLEPYKDHGTDLTWAFDQLQLVEKIHWFRQSFDVPKRSGGVRNVTPATRPLYMVQRAIGRWMFTNFLKEQTQDYCYNGRSVAGAVKAHTGPYGVVVDIKNAYDQISARKVTGWLQLFASDQVSTDLIPLMVDLVTLSGVTPQGCASTPYCFNLIMLQVDWLIQATLHRQVEEAVITRYVDNIMVSSQYSFDIAGVEERVRKILIGNGFEMSWAKRFDAEPENQPMIYLGTAIYPDRYELEPEKMNHVIDIVIEATESPDPEMYYKRITGMFSWCNQIASMTPGETLYEVFKDYFLKVGHWPQRLAQPVLISQ